MWHKRGYLRFSTKPQAIKVGEFVIILVIFFLEKFFKIWHKSSDLFIIIGKVVLVCFLFLQ